MDTDGWSRGVWPGASRAAYCEYGKCRSGFLGLSLVRKRMGRDKVVRTSTWSCDQRTLKRLGTNFAFPSCSHCPSLSGLAPLTFSLAAPNRYVVFSSHCLLFSNVATLPNRPIAHPTMAIDTPPTPPRAPAVNANPITHKRHCQLNGLCPAVNGTISTFPVILVLSSLTHPLHQTDSLSMTLCGRAADRSQRPAARPGKFA